VQKGGTSVGGIGVSASDDFYIGASTASHAGVYFGTDIVYPMRANSLSDGVTSIGHSSNRFNNLYLSGGVYLGGTGAANYLDDYEEGTYTVNVTDASGNTSSTSYTGYYTKIGNLVEVNFYAPNISTVGLVSSDNIHFSLPFAVLANNYGIGSCVADNINFSSGRTQINPRASATVDYIILRGTGSNITDDGVIVSELTSTVSDIFLSITYRTS